MLLLLLLAAIARLLVRWLTSKARLLLRLRRRGRAVCSCLLRGAWLHQVCSAIVRMLLLVLLLRRIAGLVRRRRRCAVARRCLLMEGVALMLLHLRPTIA